jgi:hypothetical protein
MDGPNQRKQLGGGEPLTLGAAATPPGAIAVDAHREDLAQRRQRIMPALLVNPGVLHRRSFAKNAAAFFAISSFICSRLFSAPKRESSIYFGVTALAPAAFSLPNNWRFVSCHKAAATYYIPARSLQAGIALHPAAFGVQQEERGLISGRLILARKVSFAQFG